VWALSQSRGDGHRSLVTPERVLSEYNKDLIIFFKLLIVNEQIFRSILCFRIVCRRKKRPGFFENSTKMETDTSQKRNSVT